MWVCGNAFEKRIWLMFNDKKNDALKSFLCTILLFILKVFNLSNNITVIQVDTLIDWLFDWIMFKAASSIFQPFNSGKCTGNKQKCFIFEKYASKLRDIYMPRDLAISWFVYLPSFSIIILTFETVALPVTVKRRPNFASSLNDSLQL